MNNKWFQRVSLIGVMCVTGWGCFRCHQDANRLEGATAEKPAGRLFLDEASRWLKGKGIDVSEIRKSLKPKAGGPAEEARAWTTYFMLATVGVLGLLLLDEAKRQKSSDNSKVVQSRHNVLEENLLTLDSNVPFTVKMATEGTFCLAELGWGKTWLVYMRFLRAYLRTMGGVILGAKSEDLPQVMRVFEREKALHRLKVISPREGNRINFFDTLCRIAPPGAQTEEIVGALSSLMEIDQRSARKGGGDDGHFFKTMAQTVISSIITTLRLAGEKIGTESIYQFLRSLPVSSEQLASEEWRKNSYANRCMEKAYTAAKSPEDKADFQHAFLFLFNELAELNSRTRSSIDSTVSSMIGKLSRGWVHQLWCTDTNARLDECFDGTWFYIDTSPVEFGESGVYSSVIAKHIFQRMVQRRNIDSRSRPVALFSDEVQGTVVPGTDRDFQAICRQKLCCSFSASQNLTGLVATLGGEQAAETQIKSWIALYGCKIFGANSCWTTNTYASELCGSALEFLGSGTMNRGKNESTWDLLTGNADQSTGWSEHYQPVLRPEEWVRLRKPEPPSYEADAIVVMTRLQQMIGQHWMRMTFRPDQ